MPVRENNAARPVVGRYGTDGLSHIRFGPFDALRPKGKTDFEFEPCPEIETVELPEFRPRSPPVTDLDGCTISGAGGDIAGEENEDKESWIRVKQGEGEELRHTFAEANTSPKVLGGETLGAGRGPRHGR